MGSDDGSISIRRSRRFFAKWLARVALASLLLVVVTNNIVVKGTSILSLLLISGTDLGGSRLDIFQPLYDMPESILGKELLAPPEDFWEYYKDRFVCLDTITIKMGNSSLQDRVRFACLEMLKSHLSGTVFNSAENTVQPILNTPRNRLSQRESGLEWTYLGDTMTSWTMC
jgi:hypothetical protein